MFLALLKESVIRIPFYSCKITHNFNDIHLYDVHSVIIDCFSPGYEKHDLKINKIANYF